MRAWAALRWGHSSRAFRRSSPGLNFIVTTHKMRAPGVTWFRMPLFVWAHYATSLIQILGTLVIAATLLLVALERVLRLGFLALDQNS